MRLIDADAFLKRNEELADCDFYHPKFEGTLQDIVDMEPTVNVLQKLWNALYAEADKFEKRYISTPEHDNWFLVYRPWLLDGFGIAIKVLSEIFVSEPPKEDEG